MIIFAALKREFREISEATVSQVTALCDYELEVRRECEPVEASSKIAEMEERLRRALGRGPLKKRDLLRKVHAHRDGLWVFDHAIDNLRKHEEVLLDTKTKTYLLLKGEKET